MEYASETVQSRPAEELRTIQAGAPGAATFVMLGVIFVILAGLLALILRLRYLARHPKRDVEDLRRLSKEPTEE